MNGLELRKELVDVHSILKKVEETSSRNEKEDIFRDNKENELLKKVLEYTYNPYKIYGVGKKSLEGFDTIPKTMVIPKYEDIFELLDFLSENNLNNEIKADVMELLSTSSPSLRALYVKMILKDLRLGATGNTINKVFKGLIPSFKLMLAKKYEDRADKILDEEIIISTKLDGTRMAAIKEGNEVKFMTRQGKIIEGLNDIKEEFKELPNGVYDGELVKINPNGLDSKELFQETRKEAGKKGVKKDLVFHVFDYIPNNEFKSGKSSKTCKERKADISNILDCGIEWIKEVSTLEITNDHSRIKYWLDKATENGEEGVMVNLSSGKYECKRSNQILKVKQFHTVDLRVVGFEEGEGRLEGTLGRLTMDYKGNLLGVGSGFSDKDRREIWSNQDKYIGRVVEVNYFEETKNEQGGISLRFPTFSRIREEGKEVSYS